MDAELKTIKTISQPQRNFTSLESKCSYTSYTSQKCSPPLCFLCLSRWLLLLLLQHSPTLLSRRGRYQWLLFSPVTHSNFRTCGSVPSDAKVAEMEAHFKANKISPKSNAAALTIPVGQCFKCSIVICLTQRTYCRSTGMSSLLVLPLWMAIFRKLHLSVSASVLCWTTGGYGL